LTDLRASVLIVQVQVVPGDALPRALVLRGAIASYLGARGVVDRSLADFAELYADQNDSDYATLQHAVRMGTVAAETGV
jgi:hypothetical protein